MSTTEQQPSDSSADGIPAAESEEALDLRSSVLMTQDWNFDVDKSDEFQETLTSSTDTRKKFQKLVSSAIKQEKYKQGEIDAVCRIIERIEFISLKRSSEGFNRVNFSVGVLNCFFICWLLGAYPEHIWLLYLIEAYYMIPRKFYNMWHAKPLNQALYYLDFCWFTNFCTMAALSTILISGLLGLDAVPIGTRELIFKAAMGAFCGTLMCANIALPFVACLFHDVNTMTGLFIHLMPPVVMYTFVWHSARIVEAWPTLFNLSYVGNGVAYYGGSDSIASCSTAFYFTWWIIYTCFMFCGGIDLPRKFNSDGSPANPKYDTVFHSTMRDGVCSLIGKFIRGRSRAESLTLMEANSFDRLDFSLYMLFHAIASLSAIYVSGFLCFRSKIFFQLMLGTSIVIAVVRGANRYTYYTTKMYGRVLRKEFADQIAGGVSKEGYSRMT